jgi:hypothetical protein
MTTSVPEGVCLLNEGKGHTEVGSEMLTMLKRFEEIEEKSKCLRVQFLDWASDKLLSWSNQLHEVSFKIDSQCVIKVAPRKKEDALTRSDVEIRRLRELLTESKQREQGRARVAALGTAVGQVQERSKHKHE